MKKKRLTFKSVYAVYLGVLAILVIFATLYVRNFLQKYEDTMPEAYVEKTIEELTTKVEDGTIWKRYFLPDTEPGEWEQDMDFQKMFEEYFLEGGIEYSPKDGDFSEDELYYMIHKDGTALAEVKLKAKGPAVTKLAILSYREWDVEYVKLSLDKKDYTLVVPKDFAVKVYGTLLTEKDGKLNDRGEVEYTVEDVYFTPEFEIKAGNGESVLYDIKDSEVIAQYYYYNLVLPDTLTVKVNGQVAEGISQENHMVLYRIQELEKPVTLISDYYGNEISYEGGDKIPLTHKRILCEDGYEVTINQNPVSDKAIFESENPEYEVLSEYIENLPKLNLYHVSVLEEDAKICVSDSEGNEVLLADDKTEYSFTAQDKFLDSVPKEVAAEVDVLSLAQKWSLFMSADLKLKEISPYLIKDSYQYDVAKKYATGTDITFISAHTLSKTPFTEESVSNFVWIADNCFSVDVRFVKHMILTVGSRVEDPMNDRFYFVKYDDTDDGKDNPTWKIAGMKEIVENAE